MELFGLKGSGASKFPSNLVQAEIIEPIRHGKGKYKFKKQFGYCGVCQSSNLMIERHPLIE
ncbi:MAG: hypothetical protein ACLTCI_05530 [[Clostridium] nexile]